MCRLSKEMTEDSKNSISGPMNAEMAARMAYLAKYGIQSYIAPMLARQIINDYGVYEGKCLDVGSGTALLSIELAKISDFEITALDISPEMIKLASEEIKLNGMNSRISLQQGDAQDMPFGDDYFDIIVSKGTLWFFKDKVKAFNEIYRVLKPGGITYIGCGDARRIPDNPGDFVKMLRFRFDMQRKKFQKEWRKLRLPPGEWDVILSKAGIEGYKYHSGYFWIEIRK